jgi:hypothetical protein
VFIMCLLLQCHKCVCFATLMKLCHDLIQSAFKKWLHVAIHFIQSDGWGVTKFLYSVHLCSYFPLHLSCHCERRFG